MNSSKLDSFIRLVHDTRLAQKAYWHDRSQDNLRKSLELETRLDKYLLSCNNVLRTKPTYMPDPTAKAFFDLVDTWRSKFRTYFSYKRLPDANASEARKMREACVACEKQIDQIIDQYLLACSNNADASSFKQ